MADNKSGKSLLPSAMEQLSLVTRSAVTHDTVDKDNSCCHWLCDASDDIKAVVDKIVSNMTNPDVNGSVSYLVDKVRVFDKKSCSNIEGLQTISTNLACVVTFDLNKEYCKMDWEIQEVDKTVCNDKLFVLRVASCDRMTKTDVLCKCIKPTKRTDSSEEINILESQRMQTSFLRSILHKSINKIQQLGNLDTAEGHQILLDIKDQGSLLVLGVEFVKKNDDTIEKIRDFMRVNSGPDIFEDGVNSFERVTATHLQVALIPSIKVTQCQHLLPCYKATIREAAKRNQIAQRRKKPALEISDIPEGINTELLDKMWTLTCLEQHSTCPKPNIFTAKSVLPINEIACTENRTMNPKANPKHPAGRSLSEQALEHCEGIASSASRLLLQYYYRYGHIPENEMLLAWNFVSRIIQNIEKSVQGDLTSGDPVVKTFFRSGSTAEGLKVCSPNEFDVMIPIEIFHKDPGCYSVVCQTDYPLGYAVCKVHSTESFSEQLSKCVIENRVLGQLLSPQKLAFGWFQGLVQKAINKQKSEDPSVGLKVKQNGPALMLEIQSNVPGIPETIDVDLVLAIEMTNEEAPRLAVAKASTLEAYYKKKLEEEELGKDCVPVHLKQEDLKCFWRISYSVEEKRYLDIVKGRQIEQGLEEGCQKVCLKILKTVREREVLKKENSIMGQKLNTYLLKTCLYHTLAAKPSPGDWSYEHLADRYLDLFNFFLKSFEEDMLSHFFYDSNSGLELAFPGMTWNFGEDRVNLLDEHSPILLNQIYTRMAQIRDSFREAKSDMEKKAKKRSSSCGHHNAKTVQSRRNLGDAKDGAGLRLVPSEKISPSSSYQLQLSAAAASETTFAAAGEKSDRNDLKTYVNGSWSVLKLSDGPSSSREETELNSEKRLASQNDPDNHLALDRRGNRFERDLSTVDSLEKVVHPDFEAMPWCKRRSDVNLAEDIARRMAKETRKHGMEDFEKLKAKCTEEVEVERERQERDEDSDDYDYLYNYYD